MDRFTLYISNLNSGMMWCIVLLDSEVQLILYFQMGHVPQPHS
jgi:hypothetical protein